MNKEELMLIANESIERIRVSLEEYVKEHGDISVYINKADGTVIENIYIRDNKCKIRLYNFSSYSYYEEELEIQNIETIYEIIVEINND